MISNEMFGSDIIRVKVDGYLKNKTENELITFDEKGIRNKNKLSFNFDGVKFSFKIDDNNVLLVREGNDFINSFLFDKDNGHSDYFLKDHGYSMDMSLNVNDLVIDKDKIFIRYVIIDTDCEYELLIEMRDIL